MKRIGILLITLMASAYSLADDLSHQLTLLKMDAEIVGSSVITNETQFPSYSDSNKTMAFVFNSAMTVEALKDWAEDNDFILLSLSISDEEEGPVTAVLTDVYVFGLDVDSRLDFVVRTHLQSRIDQGIPEGSEDTIYFRRADVIGKAGTAHTIMQSKNNIAGAAILGKARRLKESIRDTSAFFSQSHRARGFNSAGKLENSLQGTTEALTCGPGTDDLRCPPDSMWAPDASFGAHTILSGVNWTSNSIAVGWVRADIKWSPTQSPLGVTLNTASWTDFRSDEECIPVPDSTPGYDKKCSQDPLATYDHCSDNSPDCRVWRPGINVRSGSVAIGIRIIPHCPRSIQDRNSRSRCLQNYYSSSRLPGWYPKRVTPEREDAFSSSIGALDMETIQAGEYYTTFHRYYSDSGKIPRIGSEVILTTKIGVGDDVIDSRVVNTEIIKSLSR